MSGLGKFFNSQTAQGRANVAKATYASIAILYLYSRRRKKQRKKENIRCPTCNSVITADASAKISAEAKKNAAMAAAGYGAGSAAGSYGSGTPPGGVPPSSCPRGGGPAAPPAIPPGACRETAAVTPTYTSQNFSEQLTLEEQPLDIPFMLPPIQSSTVVQTKDEHITPADTYEEPKTVREREKERAAAVNQAALRDKERRASKIKHKGVAKRIDIS